MFVVDRINLQEKGLAMWYLAGDITKRVECCSGCECVCHWGDPTISRITVGVFSFNVTWILRFWLVEVMISSNQKSSI